MALVLCQQCLSWVEPIAEQCPQCDYPIDLRTADPTLDELAAAIGPLISRIGPVRILRATLPDRGFLYATAGGLFFVPQSVERVRLVPAEHVPHSPRSVLFGLARMSLRILRQAALTEGEMAIGTWHAYRSPMRVEVSKHELPLPGPDEGGRLPGLLMDNPGAFFFSRRSIRTIRRTFSGWALMRPNNLALRIKPLGDRETFHSRMAAFADELREAVCR
ncbi:MAG TPA: hypothetical protein VFG04_16325 [Planctomycetaceae bacterium]|jgi:hypothetical protein|nr:hypothetical protein [Planctomycetaceae bacterium]